MRTTTSSMEVVVIVIVIVEGTCYQRGEVNEGVEFI